MDSCDTIIADGELEYISDWLSLEYHSECFGKDGIRQQLLSEMETRAVCGVC